LLNASFPSFYKKIALDTNIFIYVFEQHPELGEKAKWLLEQIIDLCLTGFFQTSSFPYFCFI
jgi:predicted nucleic acid-binding protein